jgi:2-keto-4-pentenoate hydratase/2-oxohepta-3-ene-1,7-dioic acid hydratase in catechol pathway
MSAHPTFALGTFAREGGPDFAGLVLDGLVLPLEAALARLGTPVPVPSLLALLDGWPESYPRLVRLAQALAADGPSHPRWADLTVDVSSLRVRPPLRPRQLLCAGANYRRHVVELSLWMRRSQGLPADEAVRAALEEEVRLRQQQGSPYLFAALPGAIAGPYDDIVLPREGQQHDWELELAVVMGHRAWRVRAEEALEYVAGYTIANDITTRDLVFREDIPRLGADWLRSKCRPTFFPLGPYLVPSPFVADPMDLRLTLRLNGQVMQDESTADMIFGVAELVSYASSLAVLHPGDVLLTGSPAGNGAQYGRFLRPGDVLEGEIEGLGQQRNRCLAEGETAP